MNWTEHEKGNYCPLYYEFIAWYRERVHGIGSVCMVKYSMD